jgi:DNA-directed RNA polymerase III subunit RPC8
VWKVKGGDEGEGGGEADAAEEGEGAEMYFDNNEVVRFQVVSEEWHDQAPSGPQESADQPASELLPPYKITGSMKAAGLGCTIWWD